MDKRKLKNRIVRRLERLRSELSQTIVDKQWWNNNRLDAPPFDIGWDLMMRDLTTKELAAWAADDFDAARALSQEAMQLFENGRTVG